MKNQTGKSKTSKKGTSKKTTGKEQKKLQNDGQSTTAFHTVLVFFRYNPLGKFLIYSLCIVAIILLNVFLSGNKLETFGLLTGIELLIFMITFWTLFLLRKSSVIDTEDIEEE